jgi:hypothetical protein
MIEPPPHLQHLQPDQTAQQATAAMFRQAGELDRADDVGDLRRLIKQSLESTPKKGRSPRLDHR